VEERRKEREKKAAQEKARKIMDNEDGLDGCSLCSIM
jgi:hypothetical protein